MLVIGISIVLGIYFLIYPVSLMYVVACYSIINGLAPRSFIDSFKLEVGSINIFPLDLTLGFSFVLIILSPLIKTNSTKLRKASGREQRWFISLVYIYIGYLLAHLAVGFLKSIPLTSLIRIFAQDVQLLYLFIPLLFVKNERQLYFLLLFIVALTLVYPFGQILSIGSDTNIQVSKESGVFRLGYGDFVVVLSLGLLAIITWSKKYYLAALPAIGILMLAHRSGYIAAVIAVLSLMIMLGKKAKAIVQLPLVGILLVLLLFAIQSLTSINIVQSQTNRVAETFEMTGTTSARITAMKNTMHVFKENPLFGISYNGIYDYQKKVDDGNAFYFNVLHPHNFIMDTLSKQGIIGVGLLMTILIIILNCSRKLARYPGYKKAGSFLFSAMLFFIIFSTMNTTFRSAGYVLWFLAGTTLWLLRNAKSDNDIKSSQ